MLSAKIIGDDNVNINTYRLYTHVKHMKNTFIAIFGDEEKEVSISRPNGVPGGYDLTIDNYHCGQFVKYADDWRFYSNGKYDFTTDDIDALIERVVELDKDLTD